MIAALARNSDASALFVKANDAWNEGRLKKAFRLFLSAAEQGNVDSENTVGYFFDHGIGVKRDRYQAVYWYKKAARHGDSCACGNLAISYRDKQNVRAARFWFAKALARGDMDAAIQLAHLDLRSRQSALKARAIRYLRRALKSAKSDLDVSTEARNLLQEINASRR